MSLVNHLTKSLILNGTKYNPTSRFISSLILNSTNVKNEKQHHAIKNSLLYQRNASSIDSFARLRVMSNDHSLIFKRCLSETTTKTVESNQQTGNEQQPKKMSKFKQFYSQYGPTFLIVHLITVVLWIYGFFLISKQGYDITQLLNVFHKLNIMSKSTVESIHHKIDNYKTNSGWITGADIKHFATAYMVYKVIAPFRYMVSIGLVRVLVKTLRTKGLMKT